MRRWATVMLGLAAPVAVQAAEAPNAGAKDPPGVVEMTQEQQKTIELRLATAKRQEITEALHVPGTVGFDPGHVAVLRPFGEARVLRLRVAPGDVVTAGQVLAELEMPGLASSQQNLAAGRAGLHEAQAGVSVAANALRRGQILARDGSLAVAEADRRRLVLAQAKAAEEAGRARVSALEADVARLDPLGPAGIAGLKTPIGGVVATVSATPGEVLGASGETMMVADLSTIMVLAQVPESSAASVAVGDRVQVSLAGSKDRRWDGRIATLAAALDPQSRTLPVRIVLANPDRALRVGMYLDVTVTRDLDRESVVVPEAAVQLIKDKRVVFTPMDGGKFRSHEVEVGAERQNLVEIRRGIAAGDTVVTQGSFELKALLQKSMLGG